jgi:isopentenyl-diphosphate delta-isomerase type 1
MNRPRPVAADPAELFDVVDAQDRVIGQAPRGEVHAKGLLHRATHVMVHDANGNLFLQRRSLGKDTFPGCWDSSCSGHLDAGEDYPGAARRELGEEIGWHDASLPLRPLVKLSSSAETGHEFIQVYLLGPIAGPFDLNPAEISEGRWITPAELDALTRQQPEQVAGALRLLWSRHREEILQSVAVVCDRRAA